MTTRRLALFALAATAGASLSARFPEKPRVADVREDLLAADREFAKAAAEKGLDGWMSVMAEDAVRIAPIGGKAVIGTKAVRELDAGLFADPKKKLVWEPMDGGSFADGTHGFTTGKAKFVTAGADGKEESTWTGSYVTVWRKGTDGKWKVILDTGAADPPKK
jgi:ketosteroid isomerase-like protein